MKQGIKIVTIGGGSSYTPELVEGFIKRYHELPIRELWLVDIEEGKEKLEIVGNLAKRMVAAAKLPMQIHLSLDRKEALKGADFVTTQFRVGGLDARVLDERIPAQFNMLGQETNGAGGVFKALRTIPVIFDIIKDVKEVCDQAWIINFTNPAGIVSEAVFRYGDYERFIGVCNVPINLQNHFAKVLDVKVKDLIPYFGGLNHMSYVFNLYYRHKDRLGDIFEHMKKEQANMKNIDALAWDMSFIDQLGVYPSPYHKYFYYEKEMFEKFMASYKEGHTRAEKVKAIEKALFEKYQDPDLSEKPKELEERGGAYYSDVACSIISAIYNDKKEYHVINTVNDGYITNLPEGSAIEITARITKHGPMPVFIGQLPNSIKGLVQQMKAFEQVLVDAIFEKNLAKAKFALQINPLTRSVADASQAFDALVEAHRAYLDYYFED